MNAKCETNEGSQKKLTVHNKEPLFETVTNVVWYKILTTLDKTTTSNCIYRVGNEEHKESNELDRESER